MQGLARAFSVKLLLADPQRLSRSATIGALAVTPLRTGDRGLAGDIPELAAARPAAFLVSFEHTDALFQGLSSQPT